MVECPEGHYPITMAMLDLLATTCLPGNGGVSREQLASVVYVMREVFTACHKWRFKVRSDRHQLGTSEWGVASWVHQSGVWSAGYVRVGCGQLGTSEWGVVSWVRQSGVWSAGYVRVGCGGENNVAFITP